jgi:tetratricopeptide (TPR) repeat protein
VILATVAALVLAAAAPAADAPDPGAEARRLLESGLELKRGGREAEAEPILAEAVRAAEAAGDSALLCAALYRLGQTMDAQGRPPRAIPVYERLLATAEAAGQRAYVGRGQLMFARRRLQAGDRDDARRRLDAAEEIFRTAGEEGDATEARFFRGILARQTGDFPGARDAWEECLAYARDHRDAEKIGLCLNNLALLDMSLGDPGRAADRWGEAHALLRGEGRLRAAFIPAKNAALALRDLGRFDDAAAILEQQLDVARSRGYADYEANALVDLGGIALRRGRNAEAVRRYDEALRRLDASSRVEYRVDAILGKAAALNSVGRFLDALELLEQESGALRASADVENLVEMDRELGKQYLRAGRPAEALEALRRSLSAADSVGLARERLRSLPWMARALLRLEQPDEAIARLREAVAAWEEERRAPLDPEWREERAADAPLAFVDLADLLLERPEERPETERVAGAFDLLQRYKARTLAERILGPAAPDDSAASSVASLATVQAALAPGELLLDAFVGPDLSLLFAVTKSECRPSRLPGDASGLQRLVARYEVGVQPVAARAASAPDAEAAADSLASLLFGGCRDLVATAGTILFAPDGALHVVSLADLPFEGAPLADRVDLVRAPSASLLVRERARPATSPAPARMLAVAGRAADGSALPGADLEVERLARRFDGVALAAMDSAASFASLAAEAGVLHLAAHARIDDQHPWRSGLRLAPAAGEEGVIRAAEVASMRLPACLAFLSGCDTAGGRVLSGEGVLGLTGAFLAAGVPAVVATLRPVDDRATVRLVEAFYDALARGETAAGALRRAQNDVRKDPATSHASYWSSFVVVGDGSQRVALRRRFALPGPGVFLVLAAAALLGWAAVRTRGRR